MELPINEGIKKYVNKKRISFSMPGHKGRLSVDAKNLSAFDVTELDDTDNLLNPTSFIKESQHKLAELYKTVSSHYLLGGSTCGIYTMISLAVGEGDKIIVDRFCHKSVISAVILCGAEPVYITPAYNVQFGFIGGILPYDVECAVKNNPDAKAVIITSPSYYGTVSDVSSIAEEVHKAGMMLLVDEAHGAHFHISDKLPESAVKCGADMVVQSVHKTLGAFSGGALLHVNNKNLDEHKILNTLAMFQTSSPSYANLCLLESAVFEIFKMADKYDTLISEIEKSREKLNSVGKAYWIGEELSGGCNIYDMDKTRIVVNFSKLALTGYGVAEILRNKYNIEVEMADENNIVCIVTPYNSMSDIKSLLKALLSITKNMSQSRRENQDFKYLVPDVAVSPRKASFAKSETVDMSLAIGKISATTVCKYPPGIPILAPGERITTEHIKFITTTEDKGGTITGTRQNHGIDVLK